MNELNQNLKNDGCNCRHRTIPLKEYKGDLQEFADKVFSSKMTSNKVKNLGEIDKSIIIDMSKKGISINSNEIFITDKIILKYLNHSKSTKGAVIDLKRFSEVEKMIAKPKNIYEDITSKIPVYVYSFDYEDKIIKAIIQPNYEISGNYINLLKSIGIVNNEVMNYKQYRKIK